MTRQTTWQSAAIIITQSNSNRTVGIAARELAPDSPL
jgi:hypothetical protein